jgi:hypothetical protein
MTITQRNSIKVRNTRTNQVRLRSTESTKSVRLHTKLARHQGMSIRQNRASSVPTALARSELDTSPRTSRAKLVVMPHEGQGTPVVRKNVQDGKFICRWVAMVRAVPSGWYGFNQAAMANTPTNPRAMPSRLPRTQPPRTGITSSASEESLLVDNGGEFIPIIPLRNKSNTQAASDLGSTFFRPGPAPVCSVRMFSAASVARVMACSTWRR